MKRGSDKMLKYSKSGRFLGFVRTVLKRDARGQAQKDTVQPSPAIPASSRPTKGQLRNPDTDYAADQAIDRLIASRGKGAPDRRQTSPATSDAMKELARKHGFPEDHFSPENLRNADADYADDKALAMLRESWRRREAQVRQQRPPHRRRRTPSPRRPDSERRPGICRVPPTTG